LLDFEIGACVLVSCGCHNGMESNGMEWNGIEWNGIIICYYGMLL
jgi:hypothetical protein